MRLVRGKYIAAVAAGAEPSESRAARLAADNASNRRARLDWHRAATKTLG